MNDKYDFIAPSANMTSSPTVDFLVASSDPASRMQPSPLGGPQMNTHNLTPQQRPTNTNEQLIYTNNNVNNNYDVTPIKPQQSINLRNLLEPEADTATANVTSQPQQQLNEQNDEDLFINHWFQQPTATTTAQPQQQQQRVYTNLTPVVETPQQQPNIFNPNNNIQPQQQLEFNDHPVTYTATYQPQQQQYQSYGYAAATASPGRSAYNQASLIPVQGYSQAPQPRIIPQQQQQLAAESMDFEDPSRGVSAKSKQIRKKPRYPAKGTSEYVEHRRKNNEAVRRSRAKQKMKQLQQSKELENLKRENNYYRCQLNFEQQHRNNNNM